MFWYQSVCLSLLTSNSVGHFSFSRPLSEVDVSTTSLKFDVGSQEERWRVELEREELRQEEDRLKVDHVLFFCY